jgi:hypothetical protein
MNYHEDKPRGRQQLVQAINEVTVVTEMNWYACTANTQWLDWQHAYSVMGDILQ